MKVLVCGGREFHDYHEVGKALLELHDERRITLIVHGGAPGADTCADRWARANAIHIREYRADWQRHGRAAGPLRNQRMLNEEHPDLVVAFPGGAGTADMVRRARAAGVQVREVRGL